MCHLQHLLISADIAKTMKMGITASIAFLQYNAELKIVWMVKWDWQSLHKCLSATKRLLGINCKINVRRNVSWDIFRKKKMNLALIELVWWYDFFVLILVRCVALSYKYSPMVCASWRKSCRLFYCWCPSVLGLTTSFNDITGTVRNGTCPVLSCCDG